MTILRYPQNENWNPEEQKSLQERLNLGFVFQVIFSWEIAIFSPGNQDIPYTLFKGYV